MANLLPCPFCGTDRALDVHGKPSPCDRPACVEASARVPLAQEDSRGIPTIRKGYCSQSEGERVRKQTLIRLLPRAQEKLRRYAAACGAPASAIVERWILSLPEPIDGPGGSVKR